MCACVWETLLKLCSSFVCFENVLMIQMEKTRQGRRETFIGYFFHLSGESWNEIEFQKIKPNEISFFKVVSIQNLSYCISTASINSLELLFYRDIRQAGFNRVLHIVFGRKLYYFDTNCLIVIDLAVLM